MGFVSGLRFSDAAEASEMRNGFSRRAAAEAGIPAGRLRHA